MTGKERRKQWRPRDPDGQPCVLPHDFGLRDAAALATLEVRKDEWVGVYQNGGYPPYGELLCASGSPKSLCRKLKRRRGVTWPLSARLARTKEELCAPLAPPEQRPPDWCEELRRVRNMDDGIGFTTFEPDGPGAWDDVRRLAQALAQTDDLTKREDLIASFWRMHPKTAEKLGLPKLTSSLNQTAPANAGAEESELTRAAAAPRGFDGLGAKEQDLSKYLDSSALTEQQHACLSLKLEYGLGVTEIGRRLNIHHSTVQEHIDAGKKTLQREQGQERRKKRRAIDPGSQDKVR